MSQQGWPDHAEADGERIEIGHDIFTKQTENEADLSIVGTPTPVGGRPARHMPAAGDGRPEVAATIVEIVRASAHRGQPSLGGSTFQKSVELRPHLLGGHHRSSPQLIQRHSPSPGTDMAHPTCRGDADAS